MKRKRHTSEQIIRKLREADGLLAEGKTIAEVGQRLEISDVTRSQCTSCHTFEAAWVVKVCVDIFSTNAGFFRRCL